MNEYIGMVKPFAGNFAPRYWAFCDGSLLPIATNTALFSILGTMYGGDGKTTFALPDLRSRVPMGPGPNVTIGDAVGVETVTLNQTDMPLHNHALLASTQPAAVSSPTTAALACPGIGSGRSYVASNGYVVGAPNTQINSSTLLTAGFGGPHNNLQPFLAVNFIICTQGTFPPRN